jgi:glycosyltransferase involved in cell wall biosynthesis
MRIAYVITELGRGGSETQLGRLVQGVVNKHDILVISLTKGGEIADVLRKEHIAVKELHVTPFNAIKKLRSELLRFNPDIIHAFLWHANVVSRLAGIGIAPVICSLRGKEPAVWRYAVEYVTRPLVDYYTTNSHYIASFYHLSKKHMKVIYNGVPESFWKSVKRNPQRKHAIMVGHLRWEKDYKTLLEAALITPDWHFTCVGRGPREKEIKDYVAKHNLKNVTILGFRTDIEQLIVQSECLIHLSFTEGSPNTVIEAMLLGVPVIASDIPALRELVKNRGILVKPKNAKAVHDALKVIHKESPKEVQIWAQKTFAVDRMIKENEEVYDIVRHRRDN